MKRAIASITIRGIAWVTAALVLAVAWSGGAAPPGRPASAPAKSADNLSYWLNQAQTAPAPPAGDANAARPAGRDPNQLSIRNPFEKETDENFHRQDALPGVLQLSDGQVFAGYMYTTAEKDWLVGVGGEGNMRWRRVPFLAALSISAVVLEEKMEPVWRWKEMGVPERVYTGEEYPTRKLDWTFHLIDDSTITGTIKGQPIWIEQEGEKHGPYVLNETVRGPNGQKLKDLVTVQRILVSQRLMEEVLSARKSVGTAPRPGAKS